MATFSWKNLTAVWFLLVIAGFVYQVLFTHRTSLKRFPFRIPRQTPPPVEQLDLELPINEPLKPRTHASPPVTRPISWCKCSPSQQSVLRSTRFPEKYETYHIRFERQKQYEFHNRKKDVSGQFCQCPTDADRSLQTTFVDPCIALSLVNRGPDGSTVVSNSTKTIPKVPVNTGSAPWRNRTSAEIIAEELNSSNMLGICDEQAVIDPGLPPVGTPTRVAHCVTGDTEFMMFPEVFMPYEHMLTNTLDAPSDIFVVLDGLTGPHAKPRNRVRFTEKVKKLWHAREVRWLTKEEIASRPGWSLTSFPKVEVDRRVIGHLRQLFLKREMCYRMVRAFEEKHQMRFTHIIDTRTDLILPVGVGPAGTFNSTIWIPTYGHLRDPSEIAYPHEVTNPAPRCLKKRKPGFDVVDKFAVVPAEFAHRYFRQLLNLLQFDIVQKGNVNGDGLLLHTLREAGLAPVVEEHNIIYKTFVPRKRCVPGNDYCP